MLTPARRWALSAIVSCVIAGVCGSLVAWWAVVYGPAVPTFTDAEVNLNLPPTATLRILTGEDDDDDDDEDDRRPRPDDDEEDDRRPRPRPPRPDADVTFPEVAGDVADAVGDVEGSRRTVADEAGELAELFLDFASQTAAGRYRTPRTLLGDMETEAERFFPEDRREAWKPVDNVVEESANRIYYDERGLRRMSDWADFLESIAYGLESY